MLNTSDSNPVVILSVSNMHAAFDSEGSEVFCTFADRPAWLNDGFCQFCGDTEHKPLTR